MRASKIPARIRVGFDFDGVLFYNATRNLRPFIYFVKRYLFGITKIKFYIPHRPLTQRIAIFLHKSSTRPNRGFELFLKLLNNPRFETYIITARPSFMKDDIHQILKPYPLNGLKEIIQNKKDEQPHLYKEALIKKLKLDFYVDDNWDIVKHLSEQTQARIIWIDNTVDSWFIKYPHRSRDLRGVLQQLRERVRPSER